MSFFSTWFASSYPEDEVPAYCHLCNTLESQYAIGTPTAMWFFYSIDESKNIPACEDGWIRDKMCACAGHDCYKGSYCHIDTPVLEDHKCLEPCGEEITKTQCVCGSEFMECEVGQHCNKQGRCTDPCPRSVCNNHGDSLDLDQTDGCDDGCLCDKHFSGITCAKP
eukprot:UN29934